MSRQRLALSTLVLAVCGLAFVVESSSSDADYPEADIFTVGVDGSGRRNLTKNYTDEDNEPALSPDGRTLVFSRYRSEGGYGRTSLYVMAARGGRARELVRITDGDASGAAWSRDGRYIAFTSGDRVGVVRRTGGGLTWIADFASDLADS
jgi:Tol biopolymer transport system component